MNLHLRSSIAILLIAVAFSGCSGRATFPLEVRNSAEGNVHVDWALSSLEGVRMDGGSLDFAPGSAQSVKAADIDVASGEYVVSVIVDGNRSKEQRQMLDSTVGLLTIAITPTDVLFSKSQQ